MCGREDRRPSLHHIRQFKPSKKADYEVSVAKAEADYAVDKEKCDALADDAKDSCVTEAKKRYGK
ncbi:MAG: hypothetical protein ACYCTW_02225 [Sulfuricella sp.]